MIDVKQSIVSTINTATGVTTYYELFYQPGELPAITYKEIDNASLYRGDTVNYSTLRFEVKIYARTLSEISTISYALDQAMMAEGWVSYFSTEANDGNNTIIKVIRYVAIGYDEV